VDYLVADSQSYGPYLNAPQNAPNEYNDYMRIFEQCRELIRFSPSKDHPGSEFRVFKVRP
jgi:hypothetical protein